MRASWSWLLAVLTLATLLTERAPADEECGCGEVLRTQFPLTYAWKEESSFASNVWSYFCSADFETKHRAADASAEVIVPIEGVPIPFKGGAAYDESWKKRTMACSEKRDQLSTAQAAQVYFRLVPNDVQINAQNKWGDCMSKCGDWPRLVKLTSALVGDTNVNFTLTLAPAAQLAYVTYVTYGNLKCPAVNIKPLAQITTAGIGESCEIVDKTKPAHLAVAPSYGSPVSIVIAAAPLPKPTTTTVPRRAESASAAPADWTGSFSCGESSACPGQKVLVGTKDGTACGIVDEAYCSDVKVLDQNGADFPPGVTPKNCVSLNEYSCGARSECPTGKVLVGIKDGTGCGILNGGKCCDLVGKGYSVIASNCSWGYSFACGGKASCSPGQAMTGVKDGTGCGVPNDIKCCDLAVQHQ